MLFALNRLSVPLRSDVLSGGTIATRFNIAVNRPIRLTDEAVVNRDILFSAFRAVADGVTPQPLVDQTNAVLDAKVGIDADDAGIVEIGTHRLRFPYAALLSGQLGRRSAVLRRALFELSLTTSHSAELTKLVSRPFSNDDFFFAVGLLSSAPEFFARLLKEKVEKRPVGEADLLPDDVRHWENLTAAKEGSPNLRGYIDGELAFERGARMAADPVQGFRSISLTFCAPGLVPRNALNSMNADTAFRMIEGVVEVDDHFALVGAFEISADWVKKDARFIELGDHLLDRLFADTERLRRTCGMFAAAFVIATARLAMHEELHDQPVYWRRLAAASHAGLVVRTCGVSDVDHEELLSWAMRLRGQEYLLSVFRDMTIEPQWRPEWADPDILAADVFGRAYAAFRALASDIAPKGWKEQLEKGKAWIDEKALSFSMAFPAVLEGERRTRTPTIAELDTSLAEFYQRLFDEPSLDNFLRVTNLVQAFGVPPGLSPSALKVLQRIRNSTDSFDDHRIQAALTLSAHIAVLTNDVAMADFIAETCLDKARSITKRATVYEAVFRIIECSAASPDWSAGRAMLVERLEALALILPATELMTTLVGLLESLSCVEAELLPLLGRALHTAKLAVPRSAVA